MRTATVTGMVAADSDRRRASATVTHWQPESGDCSGPARRANRRRDSGSEVRLELVGTQAAAARPVTVTVGIRLRLRLRSHRTRIHDRICDYY
jgi:hypothetical protein